MTAKLNNAGSVCRNLHRRKKNQNLPGVLPELSRAMAYTTRNTVNRLAFKQLHLYHVVPEQQKRRNKPKNRARETYARSDSCKKHQNVSRETYCFLSKKKKATASPKKKTQQISVIRIYLLYHANSSNRSRAWRHNTDCK